MLKKHLYLLLFLLSQIIFSQQKYIDSIAKIYPSLQKDKRIQIVLNIPFDKAVSNIKKYTELVQKSISSAEKTKDSSSLAKLYIKQAVVLHFSSKVSKSIQLTLKAITIFNLLNDTKNMGKSYLELGWKLKERNLNNAFSYMKKGINILEKNHLNLDILIGGYNNFGVLYQMKKHLDSALYFHQKSLFLAKRKKDSIGIPFAQTHIAEIYLKKQQFYLAKKYLDSAFFIRKKRNDIYGITDTYLYLGDLYDAKKNHKKAITYFKKGYSLAQKHHYFPLKKYAVKMLHQSYDSIKDIKNALKYYKLYTQIKDSILNKNTNNKIAELEIKFLIAIKDKKIAQQKEVILSKELVIKTRNFYTITLSVALFFLGVIFFGVLKKNQFKRKQLQKEIYLKEALAKIKTQNRLQEQRLRISRDLHDNIGSQLTFIISSIDNLKYLSKNTNNLLKEKLSNISSFTSDTISQLRDTIWAMNKSDISFSDLHIRVLSYIEKAKSVTKSTNFIVINNIKNTISLPSIQGMHVFRVLQEAVNNAIKYADACKILITASQKNQQLFITIKDNGKGFDITKITLGNGLSNMEKRMSEIGGEIKIESSDKGTIITITLPLKNTLNDV